MGFRETIRNLGINVRRGIVKLGGVVGKVAPGISNLARGASGFLAQMPGKVGLVGSAIQGAFKTGDALVDAIPEGKLKEKAKELISHPGKAVKAVTLTKTQHPIQALPKDFDPAMPPSHPVNPLLLGGLH